MGRDVARMQVRDEGNIAGVWIFPWSDPSTGDVIFQGRTEVVAMVGDAAVFVSSL